MSGAPIWIIRGLSESVDGREFLLMEDGVRIGRAPECDIILEDESISPLHATIHLVEDQLVLTDESSETGIFVNDVRQMECELHEGDEILIGPIRFLVGLDESVPAAPEPEDKATQTSSMYSKAIKRGLEVGKRIGVGRLLLYGAAAGILAFILAPSAKPILVAAKPQPAAIHPSFFFKAEAAPSSASEEELHAWMSQANQALLYDDLPEAMRLLRKVIAVRAGEPRAAAMLERAQARLSSLLQIYYESGVREYEKLYFDRAIREWQKVVTLAGDLDPSTSRLAQERIAEAQARLSAQK